MSLDFAVINARLDPADVVPQWIPGGKKQGREYVARNPNRHDANPGSFSVNLTTGKWADFATGDTGGDLVALYAYLFHGNDQGAAARALMEQHGITVDADARAQVANDNVRKLDDAKPEPILPVPDDAPAPSFKHFKFGDPSKTWTYRDTQGRTLLHVCRFDPEGMRKQVVPLTYCTDPKRGSNRWAWRGITKGKRPLYRLDALAANPDADAIVVEGEKAADAAHAFFGDSGAIATTWLGGVENADKAHLKQLHGRRVILWPDFDTKLHDDGTPLPLHEQPGMRAMMTIAQQLKGRAREILIVGYTLGEYVDGWDVADAADEGWSAAEVMQYMATRARDPWAPEPSTPDDVTPLASPLNPFTFPHVTDKGSPLDTVENLAHIMTHYGISARYNVIAKDVSVTLPGETFSMDNNASGCLARLASCCALNRMPKGSVADYLLMIADRDQYNAAAEWIDSKPWDGVDRIGALTDTLDPLDRELAHTLLKRWMIGAAGCVFEPAGMAMQGVLVLQGEQYSGKTTWFWSLTNRNRELAREGMSLNPADRDSVKGAISYWLVELGELDSTFRKADIAALKAFLTKDADELRLPFARAAAKFPRRTAFFATVNPKQYLHDDTGNRRYWTVAHGPNLRGIHDIDMQQAWAQAKVLWQSGEQHRLTRDEMQRLNDANTAHAETNPIEELICGRWKWGEPALYGTPMTATDVLIEIGYDRPNSKQTKEAAAILRRMAGEPRKSNGRTVFDMPQRVRRNDEGPPF